MNRLTLLRRGFTLIELITVMGITVILLTIISIPMIQGFNLTRTAQAFANSQAKARQLMERITREISNSAGVRDNSGKGGAVIIRLPGKNGAQEEVRLEYVKLDIVPPAQGEPIIGPNGSLRNPNLLIDPNGDPSDPLNWKEDPTLRSPIGQVNTPASQGFRLVRYFIGLRNPFSTAGNGSNAPGIYTNPYDGLLTRIGTGERDNLYVLFRAEVDLKIWDPVTQRWTINREMFDDADNDGVADNLDDERFFLPDGTPQKAARVRAWLRRSNVVTEVSRYDMILPDFDRRTRQVKLDYNSAGVLNVPRVLPLVQFRPTRISSEPSQGQVAVRAGEESSNETKIGPDVFQTAYGGWTSILVRTWPTQLNVSASWTPFESWQPNTPYLIGRNRIQNGQVAGFSIFAFDPSQNGASEGTGGTELFDVKEYFASLTADPNAANPPGKPLYKYPFSHAVDAANQRSGWLSDAALRDAFIGYAPDPRRGKVIASFAITEVGNGDPIPQGRDNRPTVATGKAITVTQALQLPGGDPDSITGNWYDAGFAPSSPTSAVNRRFNKLWNDWNGLAPSLDQARYCKRFVDLRVTSNLDGSAGPMTPVGGLSRARIVPGSEVIIGPDQTPGPNYGRYVRYMRVTQRPVGPNQYFINYVNQKEPDWQKLGFVVPPTIYDPRTYDPQNFVQAILQPQFRAGYVEFNSRFGEPLPDGYTDAGGNFVATGNILASYRFQFTEPNDVFGVDYDSRQVMQINLTIRNFPQTTFQVSQLVSLKGSATVRNFIR